jgi:hypothetical protein
LIFRIDGDSIYTLPGNRPMQTKAMRAYRYHVVIISVILTLWSAARAKSVADQGETVYLPPPPMQWISDFKDSVDVPYENEIEQEVSAIEW